MPELPEVETVRRGLAERVVGRTLTAAHVANARAARRQPGGAGDLRARTEGRTVTGTGRRGKYLWLSLDDPDTLLVAHLGMSGQFRITDRPPLADSHARVWWRLDDGAVLVFRDQRTFGWVLADDPAGSLPRCAGHIAMDPFDPGFDRAAVVRGIRASRSGIKRLLLGQRLVSGIGNIYADEALWQARTHPDQPGDTLSARRAGQVLDAATAVMAAALAAGGTSFDPLYVAVNGESGWFARDLAVYGRAGLPCRRCGTAIVRERFTNRSSHRCPRCQRLR